MRAPDRPLGPSPEQDAVMEAKAAIGVDPEPREVLLNRGHRYPQAEPGGGIVVNRDVIQAAVGSEQQGLIAGQLARVDRVQQREPAHAKRAEEMTAIGKEVPSCERVEDLRGDLARTRELFGQ